MSVTIISLPYKLSEMASKILTDAGFEIGSSGSGTAEWEREGVIPPHEEDKLTSKILEAIKGEFLNFEIFEDEDEDEDESTGENNDAN